MGCHSCAGRNPIHSSTDVVPRRHFSNCRKWIPASAGMTGNMKNKRTINEISKLVTQSFKNGKADEAFITKVTTVIKKQPSSEALQLLAIYLKGLKRQIEQRTLIVESAVKLSEKELKEARKLVKQPIFAVEQKLNPSLLGGLRIKIGDEFLDFSLKSKINQIKERISA